MIDTRKIYLLLTHNLLKNIFDFKFYPNYYFLAYFFQTFETYELFNIFISIGLFELIQLLFRGLQVWSVAECLEYKNINDATAQMKNLRMEQHHKPSAWLWKLLTAFCNRLLSETGFLNPYLEFLSPFSHSRPILANFSRWKLNNMFSWLRVLKQI